MLEGGPAHNILIIEFESADAARRWYASPEYQAAKALRQGNSNSAALAGRFLRQGRRLTMKRATINALGIAFFFAVLAARKGPAPIRLAPSGLSSLLRPAVSPTSWDGWWRRRCSRGSIKASSSRISPAATG